MNSTYLRFIKIAMIAMIASFFSLVAVNNLLDYQSNYQFVQHVLSMDTTFRSPALMQRAIVNADMHKFAYSLIIAWEFLTALLCWIGSGILFLHIYKDRSIFIAAKKWAYLGLFCGFILYAFGFITIGGEWFGMWQSKIWNGQASASMFVSLILFVMIFLQGEEH